MAADQITDDLNSLSHALRTAGFDERTRRFARCSVVGYMISKAARVGDRHEVTEAREVARESAADVPRTYDSNVHVHFLCQRRWHPSTYVRRTPGCERPFMQAA